VIILGSKVVRSVVRSMLAVKIRVKSELHGFASGGSATAAFVLSGNFNGNVAGTFQLNIQSGTPSGNVFTVQGTVKDNTIVGTWTLVGVTSGCAGSGNFTMMRM
jgi:hypothetical protein